MCDDLHPIPLWKPKSSPTGYCKDFQGTFAWDTFHFSLRSQQWRINSLISELNQRLLDNVIGCERLLAVGNKLW